MLGAVHPVIHQVVDHVVHQEQRHRMVRKPRHPVLEPRGLIGRRPAAQHAGKRHQHQKTEQRKQPQQHQQRVVAVHRGQPPVAPALGRKQALQRPHHTRDQEQLQPGNQHRLGNLTRIAGRLGDVQPVDGGGYGVGGEPGDGCLPQLGQ